MATPGQPFATQAQFADFCGVAPAAVARMVHGLHQYRGEAGAAELKQVRGSPKDAAYDANSTAPLSKNDFVVLAALLTSFGPADKYALYFWTLVKGRPDAAATCTAADLEPLIAAAVRASLPAAADGGGGGAGGVAGEGATSGAVGVLIASLVKRACLKPGRAGHLGETEDAVDETQFTKYLEGCAVAEAVLDKLLIGGCGKRAPLHIRRCSSPARLATRVGTPRRATPCPGALPSRLRGSPFGCLAPGCSGGAAGVQRGCSGGCGRCVQGGNGAPEAEPLTWGVSCWRAPALPCPALPCPALPCPALPSCPALPCRACVRVRVRVRVCVCACASCGLAFRPARPVPPKVFLRASEKAAKKN